MDVDYSNFEKEDFSIRGFYRAYVEDNVDPLEAGRLRVRILGIHSMDVLEAPIENLPWAEPVLNIAYSGGANIANPDLSPGVPQVPGTKYIPTPIVVPLTPQLIVAPSVPGDTINAASVNTATFPSFQDLSLLNAGTGGNFAVPAKGSMVWIFFNDGSHLNPFYFGMCSQMRDWVAQKLRLSNELADRDAALTALLATVKSAVEADAATPHIFKGTATPNSAISTPITVPTPTPEGAAYNTPSTLHRMENISSWTSPGGTTILSNHTNGKEQLFIMHKGFSYFVAENGQVIKTVGFTSPAPTTPVSAVTPMNSGGLANDETDINAGLKNLYVIGDYNIVTMGNCFIQCNQNVQINAMSNVGVVARQGNVNVLAELGSINLESTTASINLKALNIQLEADNNIVLKSKAVVDINALTTIQMSTKGSIVSECITNHNFASSNFTVESGGTLNMKATGLSSYSSDSMLAVTSPQTTVNGDTSVLINSALVEIKGSGGVNIDGATTNIRGAAVNVNGDGTVNILGATTNVYGTGTAMIGGATAIIGGTTTTVTGIVTLGIGTVAPAGPATPVGSTFTKPEIPPVTPYAESPFVPAAADVPIVATVSQII
jgi:hypothetical protein